MYTCTYIHIHVLYTAIYTHTCITSTYIRILYHTYTYTIIPSDKEPHRAHHTYLLTTSQSQILHLGRLDCRTSLASSRSSKLQCTNDKRLSLVSIPSWGRGRRPHRLALSLRFKYRRLYSLLILCGIRPQRLLRCRSSCLSSCRPHSQSGMTPRRLQLATNSASSLTREAKQAGRGPLVNSLPPTYAHFISIEREGEYDCTTVLYDEWS